MEIKANHPIAPIGWWELSIKEYFESDAPCWQTVYCHFHKWSKDGSFKRTWIHLLASNKNFLDLSSMPVDGSHTVEKREGEAVGYQSRRAAKTSNSLHQSDNTGQLLAVSTPQEGQHNDLYDIEVIFGVMDKIVGVFLNADPGFDSEEMKRLCAQKEIELNVKTNEVVKTK